MTSIRHRYICALYLSRNLCLSPPMLAFITIMMTITTTIGLWVGNETFLLCYFRFFWFWFDLFCAWFVINLFSNKVNRKSASMQCDCVLQQQPLLNSNKHSLFKYIYCQVQVSTCIRQNSVNRKMKWDKICQRQHLAWFFPLTISNFYSQQKFFHMHAGSSVWTYFF